MDHSIPYSRAYASDSDDKGPDEEGFTVKEAKAFEKVLRRDHRTPLFKDVSLADEAMVDGDKGVCVGVRPSLLGNVAWETKFFLRTHKIYPW